MSTKSLNKKEWRNNNQMYYRNHDLPSLMEKCYAWIGGKRRNYGLTSYIGYYGYKSWYKNQNKYGNIRAIKISGERSMHK